MLEVLPRHPFQSDQLGAVFVGNLQMARDAFLRTDLKPATSGQHRVQMCDHLSRALSISRLARKSLIQRRKFYTQELCWARPVRWRGCGSSVGNKVCDFAQVFRTSPPGTCGRPNDLFAIPVTRNALREAAVQSGVQRYDVDRVLPMRAEVNHLSVLINQKIVPHPSSDH